MLGSIETRKNTTITGTERNKIAGALLNNLYIGIELQYNNPPMNDVDSNVSRFMSY